MELKDYNLYSLFIKTVELKNYSRVAEAVGLSSHHIVSDKMKMLEQRVGVKLFVRAFRSMEPTSDALVLYERVRKGLREIDTAVDNFKEFDRNSSAVIRMVMPSAMIAIELKEFFKQFSKEFPNFRYEMYNKNGLSLLAEGRVDFVVDSVRALSDSFFETIPLYSDKYIFVSTKEFLERENLTQPLSLENITASRIICRDGYSDIGIDYKPFTIVPSYDVLFSMIDSGLGIGLTFENIFKNSKNPSIVNVTVSDFSKEEKFSCAYNSCSLSSAAKLFIEQLKDFLN